MDEKQRLTDEKMSTQVGTIIDDLISSGKKAARSVLDLMVERTAQTADDIVDKKVDKIKQKLNERDCDDEKKDN